MQTSIINEPIYQISTYNQSTQTKIELNAKYIDMRIFFASKDGKPYAVIAKYKRGKAHRSSGRWTSGHGKYDVYYRVNFASQDAGNAAYRRVKKLFSKCYRNPDDSYDCCGEVTFNQIKTALNSH